MLTIVVGENCSITKSDPTLKQSNALLQSRRSLGLQLQSIGSTITKRFNIHWVISDANSYYVKVDDFNQDA
jgi:hypothetical protein